MLPFHVDVFVGFTDPQKDGYVQRASMEKRGNRIPKIDWVPPQNDHIISLDSSEIKELCLANRLDDLSCRFKLPGTHATSLSEPCFGIWPEREPFQLLYQAPDHVVRSIEVVFKTTNDGQFFITVYAPYKLYNMTGIPLDVMHGGACEALSSKAWAPGEPLLLSEAEFIEFQDIERGSKKANRAVGLSDKMQKMAPATEPQGPLAIRIHGQLSDTFVKIAFRNDSSVESLPESHSVTLWEKAGEKRIPKDIHVWKEVVPSPYHTSTAIFLAPLNAIRNNTDAPIIIKGVGAKVSMTVAPGDRVPWWWLDNHDDWIDADGDETDEAHQIQVKVGEDWDYCVAFDLDTVIGQTLPRKSRHLTEDKFAVLSIHVGTDGEDRKFWHSNVITVSEIDPPSMVENKTRFTFRVWQMGFEEADPKEVDQVGPGESLEYGWTHEGHEMGTVFCMSFVDADGKASAVEKLSFDHEYSGTVVVYRDGYDGLAAACHYHVSERPGVDILVIEELMLKPDGLHAYTKEKDYGIIRIVQEEDCFYENERYMPGQGYSPTYLGSAGMLHDPVHYTDNDRNEVCPMYDILPQSTAAASEWEWVDSWALDRSPDDGQGKKLTADAEGFIYAIDFKNQANEMMSHRWGPKQPTACVRRKCYIRHRVGCHLPPQLRDRGQEEIHEEDEADGGALGFGDWFKIFGGGAGNCELDLCGLSLALYSVEANLAEKGGYHDLDQALDEILNLSIAGVRARYTCMHANAVTQQPAFREANFEVDSLQLDCQSKMVANKQMIFPVVLAVHEYMNVPLIKFNTRWKPPKRDAHGNEHMNMQQKLTVLSLTFTIMPIEIKLEDSFLNLIMTLPMLAPGDDEEAAAGSGAKPTENTADHNSEHHKKVVAPTPIKFRRILFNPIKLVVTVRQSADHKNSDKKKMEEVLPAWLSETLNAVGVTEAHLKLPSFIQAPGGIQHIEYTAETLKGKLKEFYKAHALNLVGTLLGSSDMFGNVAGVIRATKGVTALVYEPLEGLNSIEGLQRGVFKGGRTALKSAGTAVAGLEGAVFGTVGKLATLATMDEDFQARARKDALLKEDRRKAHKSTAGIRTGAENFGRGLFDGVTGLVAKPMEGAMEGGVGGFFMGIGKGVVGVVAKPVAGTANFLKGVGDDVKSIAERVDEKVNPLSNPRFVTFDM